MFSSLRARLWLSYAFLILTALTTVAVVLTLFLIRNPYLYRNTGLRLSAAANVLAREPLSADRVGTVAQAFNVRILIYGSSGALILDTQAGSPELISPGAAPVARPLAAARDGSGRFWLYSSYPRADGTSMLIAAPRPKLIPALAVLTDELAQPFVQGGLIALLISVVLGYLLTRWIATPLQGLASAARLLAPRAPGGPIPDAAGARTVSGIELARPVIEEGPREVRELTRAFNRMVLSLQAGQRSQREFVANVSHELKTPLTSIQGFAQALLEGAADTPEARKHAAEVIFSEAGRMHRMAVDLLDLARLDAGTADLRISAVNLPALLDAVGDKFKPLTISAGVELRLVVDPRLPAVPADGDRLAQVLTNLMDNAVKFTPSGGTITVEASEQDAVILVSVTDTGIGIRQAELPLIFGRFYQSDAARVAGQDHGAGLGLAIVHEIVEAHGGRITVRSTPGQGTRFTVHLPVHPDKLV
jgi:two-component system OmpR family sensor kinase